MTGFSGRQDQQRSFLMSARTSHKECYPKLIAEKGGWILQNKEFAVTIDRSTGEMSLPVFSKENTNKAKAAGAFDQTQQDGSGIEHEADISLTTMDDHSRKQSHHRFNTAIALRWDDSSTSSVELVRSYHDCPLEMLTRWTVGEADILIEFELSGFEQNSDKPGVAFEFPLQNKNITDKTEYLSCWAPLGDAPYEGLFGTKVFAYPGYIYTPNELVMGIVSCYHPKRDIGLSLIIPVEDLIESEIRFDQSKHLATVRFYGARGPQAADVARYRFHLVGHEGCWRPGLKWFYERWKEYFEPETEAIYKSDGSYVYAIPSASDKLMKDWTEKMDLRWQELIFTPVFGKYAPLEEKWDFDMFCFPENYPDDIQRNVTYDVIRKHIDLLHKYEVMGYAYFNLFHCEAEMAEKEFPDCIMKDANGDYRDAWTYFNNKRHDWCMNPSPELKWGKYMISQAERLFEMLPGLDGLFVDNILFGLPDFGRHDGFSFINGKAAFDCALAHEELIEQVMLIAERYGKTAWCNGPNTLRRLRRIGGVMSESVPEGLGKFSYFCIHKPLLLLGYEGDERSLQYALKCGARTAVRPGTHWSPREPEFSEADVHLYQSYLRLLKFFRARRLVLHPKALTLPSTNGQLEGPWFLKPLLDGNIFELSDGNYAVTLLDLQRSITDEGVFRKDIPIRIHLPDANKITKCLLISVDYEGYHEIGFQYSGPDALDVVIPFHGTASMVLLVKQSIDMRDIGASTFKLL